MYRVPSYIQYPDYFKKPEEIKLLGKQYTVYEICFSDLIDIYDILKKNRNINEVAFNKDYLSSISKNDEFLYRGRPYEQAVENLLDENDPGFKAYMEYKNIFNIYYKQASEYVTVRTAAGGRPDPIAYATGAANIYINRRKVPVGQTINLDVQLACPNKVSFDQIFHRAIIITSLINALEKNLYKVNVNAFMICEVSIDFNNEIIKMLFNIKKNGVETDYKALYKILVDIEFLRRICFRLMEISDVKENWYDEAYGRTCSIDKCKELLGLSDNDYYINHPDQMKIDGKIIEEDFEKFVAVSGLERFIDVYQESKIISDSAEIIKRAKTLIR